jgi:hypothetical protein
MWLYGVDVVKVERNTASPVCMEGFGREALGGWFPQ